MEKEIKYEDLENQEHSRYEYNRRYVAKDLDHLCTFEWFKKHIYEEEV